MQSIAPKHLEDRFAKLKVLVVDDDQYMRKVVRTMLTVIGVRQIHEAIDGTSGLNAIREIGPDLVLVDWEMPTIDDLLQSTRHREGRRLLWTDAPQGGFDSG